MPDRSSKPRVLMFYNASNYLVRMRGDLMLEMQRKGFEVIALAPEDEATPALKDLGVEWVDIPMSAHSLNPFAEMRTIFATIRLIKKISPDILFCFTIKPIIYGAIAARLATTRQRFAMITGLGSMFSRQGVLGDVMRRAGGWAYGRALAGIDGVFFQNVEHRDQFVEKRMIDIDRCTLVNGSGVDLTRFDTQPIPPGPPVFLMVCRLIRSKGIGEFVAAAEAVHDACPSARFILAGPVVDGPGAVSAAELAALLKGTCVEYAGELVDVRPSLKAASVVVLPTYYPEGVPRILLEALATGRPVVTTDTAGCRTTVQDGVNGALVEPRDTEALADVMRRIADDPGWAVAMGKASRRLAEQRFDVKVVNATIIGRIQQLSEGDDAC